MLSQILTAILACALPGICYPGTTHILVICLGNHSIVVVSLDTLSQVCHPAASILYIAKSVIILYDTCGVTHGV